MTDCSWARPLVPPTCVCQAWHFVPHPCIWWPRQLSSCGEKKAVRWGQGLHPQQCPCRGRPGIGQGQALCRLCRAPCAGAQRVIWAEPPGGSVPGETVCDGPVSLPLGSCPGLAGVVPGNTRPERVVRVFSGCCALPPTCFARSRVCAAGAAPPAGVGHAGSPLPPRRNVMDCALESTHLIYIPECCYYTNKHLLNFWIRVLPAGGADLA